MLACLIQRGLPVAEKATEYEYRSAEYEYEKLAARTSFSHELRRNFRQLGQSQSSA